MKKLIVIIVTVILVPAVAYGTIRILSSIAPVKDMAQQAEAATDALPVDPTVIKPSSTGNADTDLQIKNNLSRITTALVAYASNNRGKYPTTDAEKIAFGPNYLTPERMTDPVTGKSYTIAADTSGTFTNVVYMPGYECVSDGSLKISTSSRRFAVQIP